MNFYRNRITYRQAQQRELDPFQKKREHERREDGHKSIFSSVLEVKLETLAKGYKTCDLAIAIFRTGHRLKGSAAHSARQSVGICKEWDESESMAASSNA
ncbi:hypothetical protein Pst134EB_028301 [Puccinia striiformis f. sp. tritici]|nr:hypothetical protein Pst134EB_028301 [Puccinia striiformis f. sp. tritici]